ncbi:lanthionine synthetase C-like protein (macronuclear) [Tetrahymena thermophila SB210]|uniref:Lanthionine synthetase C-like protein n=1 Tax=Tetrahymena thermophila (strain SB210) TaxID=312017 RepID=I7M6F8_TETTS|nr:lanthionine synthetase C-like protein [Tetrahymena thermophila SB210]EAR85126.1 lanthionine synthetase C-like protein [Tetrahymena thermophila SB210]|eukprot:XP_001032789.1 lanthionine synthetase C-like protein [Tetrahymena thermophila SB210]
MDRQQEVRHIENPYPPFQGSNFNLDKERKNILLLLLENIDKFYKNVKVGEKRAIASEQKQSDVQYNMFDGAGSYLIAYVKLFLFFQRINQADSNFLEQNTPNQLKQYLKKEKYEQDIVQQIQVLENLIQQSKFRDITFFFSPVGVYLVSMIYYNEVKDQKKFDNNLQKILEFTPEIIKNQNSPKLYHEILYGTSGYLYNLLFIQKNFSAMINANTSKMLVECIEKIFTIIIKAGYTMKEDDIGFRLTYNFHQREYLGGAHGLFGICQILMATIKQNPQLKQIQNVNVESLIQKSILFCASLQMQSGNFPSGTHRKETDFLVQFCHGSPGAVVPLILGSQLFGAQNLLESAKRAGEDIWKFGILKKGYGICHGISGNAYAFLPLYNITKDLKWLYYCFTFLQIQKNKQIMDIINKFDLPDRYMVGVSDYPFSYMMGLAGDISLFTDCLYPEQSLFLGFEL